jgi:hypothetical protein
MRTSWLSECLLFGSFTVLLACQWAGAAVTESHEIPVTKTPLEGTWSTGCFASKKKKSVLSFSGHLVTGADVIFSDSSCSVGMITMIREGIFELGEIIPGTNSVFKYQMVLKSVKYLVQTAVAAEALNKKKVCGDSNWKAGQIRDISSCRESAMSEQVSCFTIVQIKNSTLSFGKDTKEENCATADRRPRTIEPEIKFKFVSPLP